MLLHFSEIVPRTCTSLLFIIAVCVYFPTVFPYGCNVQDHRAAAEKREKLKEKEEERVEKERRLEKLREQVS